MVCLTLSAHWTSKKIPIEHLSKSTIQPINSDRSEVDDFTSGYCGEICGYFYNEARILQVSSLTTDRPDQPHESQSAEDPTGYRRKVLSQTYMIAKWPRPSLRLLRLLDLHKLPIYRPTLSGIHLILCLRVLSEVTHLLST